MTTQPHPDLAETDERLLWMLRVLGDEFGPLGVAKVASALVTSETEHSVGCREWTNAAPGQRGCVCRVGNPWAFFNQDGTP